MAKTKTLAQLEREYARYIASTKAQAAQMRAAQQARPKAAPVAVLSRHITTTTGGKAVWGAFHIWKDRATNGLNLRDAMRYAISHLRASHVGMIVYVGQRGMRKPMPIWEAKWGHDSRPYIEWKNNPAAWYWKNRVPSS